MGFHLVTRVYEEAPDIGSAPQAILAYIAHRADDAGILKCFPTVEAIMQATHFSRRAVHSALSNLRKAQLLDWKRGGRHKGEGGRAKANEYKVTLGAKEQPAPQSSGQPPKMLSAPPAQCSVHLPHNAGCTSRTMQGAPPAQCIVQEVHTINPGSVQCQTSSQPSVSGTAENPTDGEVGTDDVLDAVTQEMGAGFRTGYLNERAQQDERRRKVRQAHIDSAVQYAMDLAEVTDDDNRKKFESTIAVRNAEECYNEIYVIDSEWKADGTQNIRNKASVINARLALLPTLHAKKPQSQATP